MLKRLGTSFKDFIETVMTHTDNHDFKVVYTSSNNIMIIKRLEQCSLYNHEIFGGDMMTSSNGNIFRVTGPLWGEFTGHRSIPLTKASDAELSYFL